MISFSQSYMALHYVSFSDKFYIVIPFLWVITLSSHSETITSRQIILIYTDVYITLYIDSLLFCVLKYYRKTIIRCATCCECIIGEFSSERNLVCV